MAVFCVSFISIQFHFDNRSHISPFLSLLSLSSRFNSSATDTTMQRRAGRQRHSLLKRQAAIGAAKLKKRPSQIRVSFCVEMHQVCSATCKPKSIFFGDKYGYVESALPAELIDRQTGKPVVPIGDENFLKQAARQIILDQGLQHCASGIDSVSKVVDALVGQYFVFLGLGQLEAIVSSAFDEVRVLVSTGPAATAPANEAATSVKGRGGWEAAAAVYKYWRSRCFGGTGGSRPRTCCCRWCQ